MFFSSLFRKFKVFRIYRMSFPVWNSDPSFNKITSTYFKSLIDLSGNFIIRNGTIKSPANTIEFDDITAYHQIPMYCTLLQYHLSLLTRALVFNMTKNQNSEKTQFNQFMNSQNR